MHDDDALELDREPIQESAPPPELPSSTVITTATRITAATPATSRSRPDRRRFVIDGNDDPKRRPERFADHWNAAQVLAGPQLALGANSPFFLGQRLWAETRIPLFTQATDTRSVELKNQGVRPRVWFGERWITSIFDLFEENVRYFPALLPELYDEEPEEVFERGEVPELKELRLHNGTVYRWNRPIYDIVGGRPHLRVENRVLPAGPSIADVMANAAFYYGTMRVLAEEDRPVWTRMASPRPSRTSRRAHASASTPAPTGPGWATCRPPSSSCAACSRWPTRASSAGASRRRCATAS